VSAAPAAGGFAHAPAAGVHTFYRSLWLLVLPVSSVLVVPNVQGTTAAYLLALFLLLPWVNAAVMPVGKGRAFYRRLVLLVAVFATLNALAQIGLSLSGVRDFSGVTMVNPFDDSVVLRASLITQSMYLLAAAITFVFVSECYAPAWDKWFLAGAVLLGAYGVYELIFYAVFQESGDVLSNRSFKGFTGSQQQIAQFGPLTMQRLKSLTGEPSMYAFTVLPFWVYALHTGRRAVQWFLLVTLILSTATTAIAGFAVYWLSRLILSKGKDKSVLLVLIALAAVLTALFASENPVVLEAYDKLIVQKLSARDASGEDRLDSFLAMTEFFTTLPPLNQLLGVGFGYVRSGDLFSTLLVNVGVVGLGLYVTAFIVPIVRLGASAREMGLKLALIVALGTAMISVPEFSYLSTWLFLGIAYHEMRELRAAAAASGIRVAGAGVGSAA
jgi:hypothetical protein